MYPDFLEYFGIRLYGTMFERILWLLAAALMLWGTIGAIRLIRKGEKKEITQLLFSLPLLVLSIVLFFRTFSSHYSLFFQSEVTIHTYSLAILIGCFLAIWMIMREGKRYGYPPATIFNICLGLLLTGFLGARILFVIIEYQSYYDACFEPAKAGLTQADCLKVFKFNEGGLVFYGGVISGAIFLCVISKIHKVNLMHFFDFAAAALPLAHAWGRMGCLGAGCCWGEINTAGFGTAYPRGSFAYDHLIALGDRSPEIMAGHTPLMHATQLYEVFGEAAIFLILIVMASKKRYLGQILASWMWMYGFWRFFTELMRGDSGRGYLFEYSVDWLNRALALPDGHITMLSTSQTVALSLIALSFVLRPIFKKKYMLAETEPVM